MRTKHRRNSITFLGLISANLVLLCGSFSVRAQDDSTDKAGPPSAPYVAALAGEFSLHKEYIYKDVSEGGNQTEEQKHLMKFLSKFPVPLAVDAVETGELRRDVLKYKSGLIIETWRSGIYRLSMYSTSPNSIMALTTTSNDFKDSPDFPELVWINAATYQGEQDRGGKKCYVYKQTDETAWIDKSTRLPVALESATMQIAYTYTMPQGGLQMPENFVKKLKAIQPPTSGN